MLGSLNIADIANGVREGRISSVQLVEQSLARLKKTRKVLNAFLSVHEDGALQAARQQDRAPAGLLAGVPLAHKDMFDRAGKKCSFGSSLPQQQPATATAPALACLEDEGGIILGGLNMAEFALGPTGHNRTFGHCSNPWNPAHITGGSSSGSAAAVSAGIVAAALGSDTGGSIRIPAACCGATGLKPTQDVVSTAGAMPLSPSLDCIGPIARNAADCEIIFRLVAERGAAPFPAPIRLAYSAASLQRVDATVRQRIEAALGVFADADLEMVDRVLPDIQPLHDLADIIQKSESANVHSARLRDHGEAYTPHVRRRLEGGLALSAPAYLEAVKARSGHQAHFVASTLAGVDALIIPTIGFAVPTIAETDEEALGTMPDLVVRMTYWTRWLNYLGVPALSIPCGFDRNGLPVGLQIVGRPYEELRLLAIARLFQDRTDWHLKEPAISEQEETEFANAS